MGQKVTLHTRLAGCQGQPTGFDYLRLFLAVSVLCFHSIVVTLGDNRAVWSSLYRPLPAALLPMFFSLSGFLVAGSWQRTQCLKRFFIHRILRIVPALAVEVFLSAMLIGVWVTPLALLDYFAHPDFASYWLNIIGHIHYNLPEVFVDNPYNRMVNVSLWTIPFELYCYIAMAIIAVIGFSAIRLILPLFLILATLMVSVNVDLFVDIRPDRTVPGLSLLFSFLWGVVLYIYKEYIAYTKTLFVICLLVSILLLEVADLIFIATLPVAYVTVWLGLLNPAKKSFLFKGDYSYGLYLFAFPLQQLIVFLFPETRVWWKNIVICLPLAFLYAMASWHWVEKPFLKLKSKF